MVLAENLTSAARSSRISSASRQGQMQQMAEQLQQLQALVVRVKELDSRPYIVPQELASLEQRLIQHISTLPEKPPPKVTSPVPLDLNGMEKILRRISALELQVQELLDKPAAALPKDLSRCARGVV